MLLYINGDELSGGACAVNDFVTAIEDIHHKASGNKAHPENIMHSYGYYLSRLLNLGMRCEATVKESNQEIYNSVISFIENSLPKLRSQYTVVVVGWMPDVEADMLNDLAAKLKEINVEFVFFNTKKPLLKSAKLTFSNLVDLQDKDECFITWCKNKGYEIKNSRYPDANAHNAWAKYIFGKMIEVY